MIAGTGRIRPGGAPGSSSLLPGNDLRAPHSLQVIVLPEHVKGRDTSPQSSPARYDDWKPRTASHCPKEAMRLLARPSDVVHGLLAHVSLILETKGGALPSVRKTSISVNSTASVLAARNRIASNLGHNPSEIKLRVYQIRRLF